MTPSDSQPSKRALTAPAPVATESQLLAAGGLYGSLSFVGDIPAGPPGLTATPTMAGLMQALRRRWLVATIAATVAAVLAVTAVFVVLPPRYVVEARFNVMATAGSGPFDPSQDPHAEFAVFKEYEKALIHAPSVLSSALNEKVTGGREARDLSIVRAQGTTVLDWMDRNLKADFKVAPEIMSAWLSGDDADGLADLLNAIGAAFVKENLDKEKARRDERLAVYRDNLKRKEQDLSDLRKRLNERNRPEDNKDRHAKQRELQETQHELGACKVLLASLQTRQGENELELAEWQAKFKSLQTVPVPPDQVDEFLRNDSKAKSWLKQLDDIDALIQEIERTAANPQIAREKIALEAPGRAKTQAQLDRRRIDCMPEVEQRYRSRLKVDLTEKIDTGERRKALFASQVKGLRDQSEVLSKKIASLDPTFLNDPPDLAHLKDEIESTKSAVDRIRQTIALLGIEGTSARVSFQMRAITPTERDYTRQAKLAGAGGVSAIALALFGVALFEFRTRRISMTDEVSRGLGLHVVGSLPQVRQAARQTPSQVAAVQAQLQEAVDGVRTMLLHAARTEPLRVIMVTSATGGEGKTSVATQLAASLARAWRKTLLIDGDLRNPAAHRVFEVLREPGLCEVLRSEVAVDDAIRPAPVSRLWILPAGQWDAHAIQALAQDDVHTLLEKLKEQYDFIIVDSSPVLPVADTLLLAPHVDGVLFSILRDVSRVPEVYSAQQRLAPLGVRTLGAVAIGMASDLNPRAYQYAAS
jgi:capsular exopolysaccharide synthesis family protein